MAFCTPPAFRVAFAFRHLDTLSEIDEEILPRSDFTAHALIIFVNSRIQIRAYNLRRV